MRMTLIVSLSLVLLAVAGPLVAAELSGTVYRDGVPTGNLSITVENRNTQTRTNAKGEYRFDLPPGRYTLIIRGQRFAVEVVARGTRYDVRF